MILGVDVGGTFTDATLVADGRAYAAKAPTTPGEESVGVMRAIRRALAAAGASAGQVSRFGHGMTVGTNALLQERGARTALLTTAGFTDVIEIGRQDRPSLYRLQQARPAPLVDPGMRFGVRERCGPGGAVEPLTGAELERAVGEVVEARPEAVAISLLFSYLEPAHEERLASRLAAALPGVPVSRSSAVLAQFREYERTSTTVIDAYLAPLLARYLETLRANAAGIGLPEPLVMRSSGGLLPLGSAIGSGAWSVLSGPAAGAVGASLIAGESGDGDAIGFDMGGTSCDACVIKGGQVLRTDASTVAGRPIQLPMVDVHTVGAGGGSIAWRDAGGVLRVGPRSAGAEPGPACYGKGGAEPTVTDANLLLGRLPAEDLPGGVSLDRDAARAAIGRLAELIGMDPIATALGVIRVASREMAGAIRTITVERGLDPRSFALLSFGGAGPLHAAEVAGELGIDRIICPRDGGTLSALGLCAAPERYDAARSLIADLSSLSAEGLEREQAELAARARGEQPLAGEEIEATYAMRYRGQSFELEIPASEVGAEPARLRRGFEGEHERLYGHTDPGGTVELVTMRVAVKRAAPGLGLAGSGGEDTGRGDPSSRGAVASVELGEGPVEARVLPAPDPDEGIAGPAIVRLPGSTLLVPPSWSAVADRSGSIVMRRERGEAAGGPGTREGRR